MDLGLARKIASVFEKAAQTGKIGDYTVKCLAESGGYVAYLSMANWLNYRKSEHRLGVYNFNRNGRDLSILVVTWDEDNYPDRYDLVVANGRSSGVVAVIKIVQNGRFFWKFKGFKHTKINGETINPKIVAAFIKEYGTRDVTFTIPDTLENLPRFLDELFICINCRLKVDAAFKPKHKPIFEFSDKEMDAINEAVDNDFSEHHIFPVIKPLVPEYDDVNISQRKPKRHAAYYRDALARAGYKCEYNNEDRLFKRSNGLVDYTEPHHLIPLNYQDKFECSLDNVANIVSLCSHCHNLLHYGRFEDKKPILQKLYRARKKELAQAGIVLKSISDLYKYYK
jgi:hypothetical protein